MCAVVPGIELVLNKFYFILFFFIFKHFLNFFKAKECLLLLPVIVIMASIITFIELLRLRHYYEHSEEYKMHFNYKETIPVNNLFLSSFII